MYYLAKGKNRLSHVKGVNVWYTSKDETKLRKENLVSCVHNFASQNSMLSFIHGSRLNLVGLD